MAAGMITASVEASELATHFDAFSHRLEAEVSWLQREWTVDGRKLSAIESEYLRILKSIWERTNNSALDLNSFAKRNK